jgi:release factor glutamine methyltransferase
MLRSVQKKIIHYTWRPLLLRYLKHDRPYSFDGLHLIVKKSVFHPGFFFSTRLLIEALQRFDIHNKSLLELGSGSGLITCWAAREGAKVLAIDINALAVENTQLNIEMNSLQSAASAVVSDLFENVSSQLFDVIVVNPPYYPKNPKTAAEQAWYCGEGFEYFQRFFQQLSAYLHAETIVLMSLSEDCDLKAIQTIGEEHGFRFETLISKRTGWEEHFIFQLKKIP